MWCWFFEAMGKKNFSLISNLLCVDVKMTVMKKQKCSLCIALEHLWATCCSCSCTSHLYSRSICCFQGACIHAGKCSLCYCDCLWQNTTITRNNQKRGEKMDKNWGHISCCIDWIHMIIGWFAPQGEVMTISS